MLKIGANCKRVKVGDSVIVGTGDSMGAFASHVVVREGFTTPKPSAMTFEAAASLPVRAEVNERHSSGF